nr:geranylgeranyl diphosphate synthase IdsB [Nocardia iowensis]
MSDSWLSGGSTDPGGILRRSRTLCDPILRTAVYTLPDPLRRMAGYHFGWWDRDGFEIDADPGKSLRAALVIASAAACSGGPVDAASAGAAVELVHNFTLVHDDIMDRDLTRRGRPTVWSVWGITDAMLLGDALQALAVRTAVEGCAKHIAAEVVSRLAATMVELCRGQQEDCAFETREGITVNDYLQMVAGKTGALMGCSCALGACCAGADAETVSAMDAFGRRLGLAFQFTDDLLGIWGQPRLSGKPVGNDVKRRKRSLPVVAAIESGTSAGLELAWMFDAEHPLDAEDADRAVELIERAGGRAYTERQAEQQVRRALAELPDRLVTEDLMILAQGVWGREK